MAKKFEKIEKSCGVYSIDDRTKEAGVIPMPENNGDKHPTPEVLLIREAVKYLTKKQRQVWEYHAYDKLTQDEIAKKLKISQPMVAQHVAAAERRIAKWCKSNMGAYELLKSDFARFE